MQIFKKYLHKILIFNIFGVYQQALYKKPTDLYPNYKSVTNIMLFNIKSKKTNFWLLT